VLSVNSGCTVMMVPLSRDASIVWRSRLARKGNKSFGLSIETLHRCHGLGKMLKSNKVLMSYKPKHQDHNIRQVITGCCKL
jgi:hypothetical protein